MFFSLAFDNPLLRKRIRATLCFFLHFLFVDFNLGKFDFNLGKSTFNSEKSTLNLEKFKVNYSKIKVDK